MRDCKRFFKGMSIVPYIIMVWLPLFFAWRETVEQIRLPDARQIGLLLNSVKLGGLAALLTCVLGGLAANYIHKGWLSDRWYRYFFVLLMPVPYYIYALSWMYLIRVLSFIRPGILKYSAQGFGACLFVETMTYLPITTLLILSALEMCNRQSEEMAMVYQKSSKVLWKNILPEILPYIVAAFAAVFILSVTDFSVPSMFQYNTYVLDLYSAYGRTGSSANAYAMSFPLLILLLLPLAFVQQAIRKMNKPQRSESFVKCKYPVWLQGIMNVSFGLLVCQVLLPVITFTITSDGMQNIWKSFDMIYEQAGVTLIIASLAALIAVLCVIPAAVFLANCENGLIWMIMLGSMAIPGSLQAMGLLNAVNGSWAHWLSTSLLMPALGCAIHYMPIALIILVSTMKRIDRKSIELAVLYEQNRYEKTLLELGMLLPGILSSFLLVFFLSFGEEGIMLVLMPPGAETVSVKIYNYLHYGASEYVSGFCLWVTLFLFLLEVIPVCVIRKRYGGHHAKSD